ncbi:glycosyltransferase family 2 protein [Corallincola platygyrae]|uniref:Glycosyltransferase family 2 protein n=1 Tax=Corallincola platygyrae TaxID=1193278 RepID=A0ABW4XJM2_9GAMM
MELLFLTTAIIKDNDLSVLDRMLASVTSSLKADENLKLKHMLLLQKVTKQQASDIAALLPAYVEVMSVDEMVSLSKARNILLSEVENRQLWPKNGIVAYPDDDCWYPAGNLNRILNTFAQDEELEFFFCNYGADAQAVKSTEKPLNASAKQVVRNASSNTIFFRSNVAQAIGGFDLNLGVGTVNNGGEDLDYALRAFLCSKKSLFLGEKLVGHRDKDNALRAKYYRGSAIVLKRYAGKHLGILFEYIRKLMIGSVLFTKREMPLNELKIVLSHKQPLITSDS